MTQRTPNNMASNRLLPKKDHEYYINPTMDFWANERTLAGKIPM